MRGKDFVWLSFFVAPNEVFFFMFAPSCAFECGDRERQARRISSADSHLTQCTARRSAWKKLWSALTALLTVPLVVTRQPL